MQNVAENLFNLLMSKDYTIKTLNSKGKEETDMEKVDMFSFDFEVDGKNFGTVVILLNSEGDMELFFGDTIGKSMNHDEKDAWTNLLYQLRMFAKRNMMGFKLENINRLKYSMQSIANVNESYQNIFEGYYGTKKTSYNPQGKAKIIIKHSKPIGEEDKRYRNISSIFVENEAGERFKLPFRRLPGARAMARHVTEGGNPYDIFGQHISEMVDNINTLSGFMRRSRMFVEDDATNTLVETGRTHYDSMRKGLKQIAGKRGYHTYKESWVPSDITESDRDVETIRQLFTREAINPKVEAAIPLLAKLSTIDTSKLEEEIKNQLIVDEAEFIDVTAMNEQSIREILEGESELYENTVEYNKLKSIIEQFKSTDPVIGGNYIYVQVLSTVQNDAVIATESHFSQPYELIGIASNKYVFNVNGSNLALPSNSSKSNTSLKQVYLFEDFEDFEKLRTSLSLAMKRNIKSKQIDEVKIKEVDEFEEWANGVVDGSTAINEGSWALPDSEQQIEDLTDWFAAPQPVGVDAINATEALYNIIGDDELFDSLTNLSKDDPEADARTLVLYWIKDFIKQYPEHQAATLLKTHFRNFVDAVKRGGEVTEEKDLDDDHECHSQNDDDKITNKGNGMNKFKDYVEEKTSNESTAKHPVTESNNNQPIHDTTDQDFKSLIRQTNFLLQK